MRFYQEVSFSLFSVPHQGIICKRRRRIKILYLMSFCFVPNCECPSTKTIINCTEKGFKEMIKLNWKIIFNRDLLFFVVLCQRNGIKKMNLRHSYVWHGQINMTTYPKDHNSELWKWYENGSRLKITWSNLAFKTQRFCWTKWNNE